MSSWKSKLVTWQDERSVCVIFCVLSLSQLMCMVNFLEHLYIIHSTLSNEMSGC